MNKEELALKIEKIINEIDLLVPGYAKVEEDFIKANGNVAVCIIDESGRVNGKIWGTDIIRGRECFRVAWTKASQVWITGFRTGEFEKKVFSGELKDTFGIKMPDFIGWEGGQPVTLEDGTKLSAGFSGFRSETDLEIVLKAIAKVEKNS